MKLKNVVAKGLIALMACGMLTACNTSKGTESAASSVVAESKETTASENTDTESKVEESKEDVVEDSKEETKEESKEESFEDIKEESAEETKEESKEDDTNKKEISGDISDPAEHYKDFFKNYSMENQMIDASLDVKEENISMSMVIKVAQVGKSSFFEFGMDAGTGMNEILMYNDDDAGYIYFEEAFAGAGKTAYKAKNDDESIKEMTDSLAGEKTFGLDNETSSKVKYDRTEVIDGVTYDVLVVDIDEGKGYYYINRDSQKLEKIEIPYEGEGTLDVKITSIDKIDFPASAKEIKSDELGEKVAADIMGIMFGALGSAMEN